MSPWLPGFEDFRLDRALRLYVAAMEQRVRGIYREPSDVEVAFGGHCDTKLRWRFYVDQSLKVSADSLEELIPAVEKFCLYEESEECNSDRRKTG